MPFASSPNRIHVPSWKRAIVRSVPSRHDNKAALLYPQPPDPNIRWPTRPLILRAPSQHSLAYSETAVYTQPRPVQEEVYNLPPNRTRSESPSAAGTARHTLA
ncbi:hypothetical protein DIPPA_06593 [Diplonema papillatum]|nr:hypothetical protein DIPPA_06593 [Diplonema papillatum]